MIKYNNKCKVAGEIMSKFVRGTMLVTVATFLTKFLGIIYVIPFNEIVGHIGGTLYGYAYVPYNILLSISTIGIPLAVSKMVAKYNALEDYYTGLRVFRTGILLMIISGFIAFLIMYFGSGFLANLMIKDDYKDAISSSDITLVMKMVSFALLIIPAMSIVRGFFQGYQSMGPTAVSMLVEQIARIAFLLISTILVVKVFDGTIATAVGFATFGAFVGGLASIAVLMIYWQRRKNNIFYHVNNQEIKTDIPLKELFYELFSYSGPFVLVGLATSLYQLVDQFTFQRAMVAIGEGDTWSIAYSVINVYGHKLVIIPVTIATGMSLSLLPALTRSYTKNDFEELYREINQALQIIFVLVIPAAVGLLMLSDVAYGSLFKLDNIEITGPLLAWYAPTAVFFALFVVSTSMLQGINQQNFAVVSLGVGLFLKLALNITFIHFFGAKGAIFGTSLGVGTAVFLNLWRVKVAVEFSYRKIRKRIILIGLFSAIMALVLWGLKLFLGTFLNYLENRFHSVIVLILGVGIGGMVYLWLAYQSTLLERSFGDRVKKLERYIPKI